MNPNNEIISETAPGSLNRTALESQKSLRVPFQPHPGLLPLCSNSPDFQHHEVWEVYTK